MSRRFITIWFRHLVTDRIMLRKPELKGLPFVVAVQERGRKVITAASAAAQALGIDYGMVVADARATLPSLQVFDEDPQLAEKLLHALAIWCLRYTPEIAVDPPDGLILDVSGCAYLWGGERPYLKEIVTKLRSAGYDVRAAIADTIGTAWAVSHYGQVSPIVEPGALLDALLPLPPAALRLEQPILERMHKLGLYRINSFISMPRLTLRRRFGQLLLDRLDQALGRSQEIIELIRPVELYQERLPCLEPIRTATGIEIALRRLLEVLCLRLQREQKGLRAAVFKGFRIDGNIQQIEIGTNRPTRNVEHLFKLFELKISTITPALGIEVFILEAPVVEDLSQVQDSLWNTGAGHQAGVANLLDRLAGRLGMGAIRRYLPDEHYWPERSFRLAASLEEKPAADWRLDRPRPICLLSKPELIEVTAPIPDYPPMLFIYKGKIHKVIKADGPERIEREWWLENGLHRDYYAVEDEQGARYWIFRLGHYDEHKPEWFIHGVFA
ncbi:DNA polymerase Y family protein [Chitinophaga oryziterrae]|uniref:DNA polymerase Y family protein n=1 Tax=Chitinophaga oryziterrae TaxID=1031224 RepID=A0A6N8JEZ8_9BACT|nr:DNA polymerase Y family protein [Chitinophaga oryziterrae]MVT42889.1 DNA polymerase Y family protein [Chitinophaga oryziterrae]